MVDDDKARRFAEVALERTGRGPLTDKEVAEDMKRTIDTSELGPIKLGSVATARDRVRAVANGATINGTYKQLPIDSLEAFRRDLLTVLDSSKY